MGYQAAKAFSEVCRALGVNPNESFKGSPTYDRQGVSCIMFSFPTQEYILVYSHGYMVGHGWDTNQPIKAEVWF